MSSATKAAAEYEAEIKAKEEARAKDIAERDALAERIRQREEAQTRKVGEAARAAKRKEEAEARARMDEKERRELMRQLRSVSRRDYLALREGQKLDEMKAALADEEVLMARGALDQDEIAQYEIKKKLYELAKRKKALEASVSAYLMPSGAGVSEHDEESKDALLKARYQEPSKDGGTVGEVGGDHGDDDGGGGGNGTTGKNRMTEQLAWENAQMAKVGAPLPPMGSKDSGATTTTTTGIKQIGTDKTYSILVEEEDLIEFVTAAADSSGGSGETQLAGEGNLDPAEAANREAAAARMTMAEIKRSLPVFEYRQAFLDAVDAHKVIVLTGETGSGKTTQLPQYLHEHGYTRGGKMIGCTQPRRVAAMSVAARVADEMDTVLGREVGYAIRFEDCTSDVTAIKYMTDGMLLREFLTNPDLSPYSVMIIDEAHERTLQTDILFGLIKDIARYRDDIRIIIASATLDAEKFSDYFDGAPIFAIPGRRYPVDVYYTKAPESDYLDAAVMTVLQIHKTQPPGDVLVFLTGQAEIEAAQAALEERGREAGSALGELVIAPIYANLPAELQAKIFMKTPEGARKVVLATNIAETSVTIDGIKYVIDPGFCKQKSFNPRSGMESLIVTPVSQAGARQRAGRAGRVAPGKCFRLYTAWSFENEMEENNIPEIQRTNLGNVVLTLKSLGIDDLIHFDFLDPPPVETIMSALEQLYALGALNDHGQLTKLGRKMAELPMDPKMSKAIISAEDMGVVSELVTVCGMLSAGNAVFFRPKDKIIHADAAHKLFHREGGDHLMLLAVYNEWVATGYSKRWASESFIQFRTLCKARDIRDQILRLLARVEVDVNEVEKPHAAESIRKAITAGYFYNTARLSRSGAVYKTVRDNIAVAIHPQSCLAEELPPWVCFSELVFTSNAYMRQVSLIDPGWLVELAPHMYSSRDIEDGVGGVKMPNAKAKAKASTNR